MRFWLFALPRLLISRFSFVKQPPSVEITRGVFLSPETFPRKIFPKIFSNLPKRLFADFLARICDEGKGVLCHAHRGGVPFFVGLWACLGSFSFRSLPLPLLSVFPCCSSCAGSFFCPLLSCRWVVLVGGAGLPSFPCPSFPFPFSRSLWASCLSSLGYRGNSGTLGAAEPLGHPWTMGALQTAQKGLK